MNVSLRGLIGRATLVATCLVLPGSLAAAEAEPDSSRLTVSAELDIVSHYVWRALTYSEGVVGQPSVTLTAGSAELNLWANVDPSLSGSDRLNEVDYSAAWSLDLGGLEAKSSLVLYTYPGFGDASTGEIQIELWRALPSGFGAFARHSLDVFDYRGASFTTLGVEREWSVPSSGSLSVTAQVGHGSQRFSDVYLPDGPALSVAGLGASWTVAVGRGWALRPHVDWLEVVEADARALLPAHTPLTFGLALGRP